MAGGRRKGVGKGRGLKYPSRQPLSWDTGHFRGEVKTCIFAGWGWDFAVPVKKKLRVGRVCGVWSGNIFRADPYFGGYFAGRGFIRGLLEMLLGRLGTSAL